MRHRDFCTLSKLAWAYVIFVELSTYMVLVSKRVICTFFFGGGGWIRVNMQVASFWFLATFKFEGFEEINVFEAVTFKDSGKWNMMSFELIWIILLEGSIGYFKVSGAERNNKLGKWKLKTTESTTTNFVVVRIKNPTFILLSLSRKQNIPSLSIWIFKNYNRPPRYLFVDL